MTDYVPEEEDNLGNVDGEEAVQGGEDADTPPSLSLLIKFSHAGPACLRPDSQEDD